MLLKFPVEIFEWVEDMSEFTEDFIKNYGEDISILNDWGCHKISCLFFLENENGEMWKTQIWMIKRFYYTNSKFKTKLWIMA